jgi:hypothetical protein
MLVRSKAPGITACNILCQRDAATHPRGFCWHLAGARIISTRESRRYHHHSRHYACTISRLLLATCYTICRNHEYDTVVSKRSPRLVACMRCSAVLTAHRSATHLQTRGWETRRYTTNKSSLLEAKSPEDTIIVRQNRRCLKNCVSLLPMEGSLQHFNGVERGWLTALKTMRCHD